MGGKKIKSRLHSVHNSDQNGERTWKEEDFNRKAAWRNKINPISASKFKEGEVNWSEINFSHILTRSKYKLLCILLGIYVRS